MPGLCGVVSSGGRSADYVDLVTRVNELPGVTGLTESCVTADGAVVSFAAAGLGTGPFLGRCSNADTVLALEGEVFNLTELAGRAGIQGRVDAPRILLALYARFGVDFPKFVDGEFNIVVLDRQNRRLVLTADHLASRPMYYWHGAREFIFGSEKKYLLIRPVGKIELDPIGLLQPFVHHHNLDDRTYLVGIKRLKPATQLVFAENSVTVRRYGDLPGTVSASKRPKELQEQWRNALVAATRKRTRDKNRLLISLSAGLDSRAVACSLDRSIRPVWARTWGVPGSLETEYAARIARALGFHHLEEDPRDYELSSAVPMIVWRTEGETQFRNGLSLFTHRRMKERGDHVMGGWLGDISSGGHLRPFMFRPARRDEFVQTVYRWYARFGYEDLANVFNPDFLDANLPLVREAFVDSYRPYSSVSNPRAHEVWDLYNRQARMTVSSMPTDSHMFGKIRPFFDRDYLEFVMSVPMGWRIGQNLYKAMIHEIGPEIRAIPYANTDMPLARTPVGNMVGYARAAVAGSSRKALRRLWPSYRSALQRRAAMDLGSRVRDDAGLRQLIESFLSSASFDGSIFDASRIRQMLASHYAGRGDYSLLISIVVTTFVALEFFFYRSVDQFPARAQFPEL